MSRQFLRASLCAATALGTLSLAEAALAQSDKPVRWRMQSTYPGSLPQLGTLGKSLEVKIAKISGGNIQIKFEEPGKIVPPLQAFDAVAKGSVDAAWSTPGYWYGKEKSLTMFSSVPFGPSSGEYMAWIYYGGGHKLMDEIYGKHGIKSVLCGIIAPEASGWFRKEIKTVDDLKGLKMRFFGLGARVMQKMGVSTQLLAAGDIYPALERGTIDATEFSMPAIDLGLGFHNIAKFYYFPGWHQQSTIFDLMMNQKNWQALSETQRAQIEVACGDNYRESIAEGDAIQFKALAELQAKGVKLMTWPPEILKALEKAWDDVVKEESQDANFAKVWASYAEFRKNYQVWKDLGYLK
jgi:TRAP-type mannitol/chloroaromatic compound transport system substrate-binding protein